VDGPDVRGAVITVGNELLLGQTIDTNGGWLSAVLSDLGIPVVRRWIVGDVDADIQSTLAEALREAHVVVLCGGLGPTEDDRTREAVASYLGRRLHEDEAWLELLQERFRDYGIDELPETNRSQCRVPEGAVLLPNDRGTAPGLLLEADSSQVVLLPGPPRELKNLFRQEVKPRLEERLRGRLRPLVERRIHTTGIAESVLAERVEEALGAAGFRPDDPGEPGADLGLAESPAEIGFYPDLQGVDLVFRVRGLNDDAAAREFDALEEVLSGIVERYRYEAESGDLTEALGNRLRREAATVAVAESCTGGLIGKRLTERAGSSAFFVGGVIAYADTVKIEQLGVCTELIEELGAVSEEVARAMAEGVAERLGADAGIGITGIAGPGGGTEEKPVGTVWYAASWRGRTEATTRIFPGDREAVRERSSQAALALLRSLLRGSAAAAPADG